MTHYGKGLTFHDDNVELVFQPIDHIDLILIPENGDDTEPYFSWRGCQCCFNSTGKRLGCDVTDYRAYRSLEHLQTAPEDYYEVALCDECYYEHHYGIGSCDI